MASQFDEITKLLGRGSAPELSDVDRKNAKILVVDPDPTVRGTLRQALVSLGFMTIADASDPTVAFSKMEESVFTHVIYDARKSVGAAKKFVQSLLQQDDRIIAIPASYEPTVDDVFDLLICGARGFLVKPFTTGSLDETIAWASKGEPISEAVLFAKSRNEALASLILTSLDKLAIITAQARQFETAKRELPKRIAVLKRAVDVGKAFANGGQWALLESIAEYCLERANGPATGMRNIRRRFDEVKTSRPRKEEQVDHPRR